ncbi:MAG: hypothetical protein ACRDQI_05810 [Pseudonocardiaceae bacterium]
MLVSSKSGEPCDFIRPGLVAGYGDSYPIVYLGRTLGGDVGLNERNEQFFRRFIASGEVRASSTRYSQANAA